MKDRLIEFFPKKIKPLKVCGINYPNQSPKTCIVCMTYLFDSTSTNIPYLQDNTLIDSDQLDSEIDWNFGIFWLRNSGGQFVENSGLAGFRQSSQKHPDWLGLGGDNFLFDCGTQCAHLLILIVPDFQMLFHHSLYQEYNQAHNLSQKSRIYSIVLTTNANLCLENYFHRQTFIQNQQLAHYPIYSLIIIIIYILHLPPQITTKKPMLKRPSLNQQPQKSKSYNRRLFTEKDIDMVLLNLFRLYDENGDNKFSKKEFPKVLMALGKIIDSPLPSEDECMDIFNLLDTNGDEVIDRHEMRILLEKFFALLLRSDLTVWVSEEWLIEQRPEELKKIIDSAERPSQDRSFWKDE